jgi:1-phosphofructokinase family hexose kinase
MLICVSLNPAIDKRLCLPRLLLGRVNRVSQVRHAAGGKAAHVAMVLKQLGEDPLWIGFSGGTTGQELLDQLHALKIRTHPVPIRESTRLNLEIIEEGGTVTEILEPGPATTVPEQKCLQDACESIISAATLPFTVIFSGSVPPGMPPEIYSTLINLVHKRGGKAFLDTSGQALKVGLQARPDFVKPNREEAQALTGNIVADSPSAINALRNVMCAGAKSAAISLGEGGLVWRPAHKANIYFAHAAKVQVRSAVGCGDATLAAFAFAAYQGLPDEETIRLAAACGAANCLAEYPGAVNASDIARLQKQIKVDTFREDAPSRSPSC